MGALRVLLRSLGYDYFGLQCLITFIWNYVDNVAKKMPWACLQNELIEMRQRQKLHAFMRGHVLP